MLKCGQKYQVKGYDKTMDRQYRHHLLAMGLVPGSSFLVKRFAPFSRTIQIELDQYNLSLRENELSQILLEAVI